MTETKTCPDCAEQVLAAARKCRHCGYRFDGARRDRGSLAGLLGSLRTDTQDASLPTILADWGVGLAEDEEVEFFRLAELDGRTGYLLLTAERIVFFAGTRGHERVLERPRTDIRRAQVTGGPARRRLTVGGEGFEHVIRGDTRGELRELARRLGG